MATKRRKRRSCKHGKLKTPVRTKNGGKRICRKSRRKSRRKTKKFNMNEDREYTGERVDPKTGKIYRPTRWWLLGLDSLALGLGIAGGEDPDKINVN